MMLSKLLLLILALTACDNSTPCYPDAGVQSVEGVYFGTPPKEAAFDLAETQLFHDFGIDVNFLPLTELEKAPPTFNSLDSELYITLALSYVDKYKTMQESKWMLWDNQTGTPEMGWGRHWNRPKVMYFGGERQISVEDEALMLTHEYLHLECYKHKEMGKYVNADLMHGTVKKPGGATGGRVSDWPPNDIWRAAIATARQRDPKTIRDRFGCYRSRDHTV